MIFSKPISTTIFYTGKVKKRIHPLLLFFNNSPIFKFLPCFAIENSLAGPSFDEIKQISISDHSMVYFVFSMDNWNRENELFYLGKTTLTKKENKIQIGSRFQLIPLEDCSDIVFIPEQVFFELVWFSKKIVFFILHQNTFLNNLRKRIEENKDMVFVHGMDSEIELYRGISPRKIYFNLGRWDEFFSPSFRDLVDMEMKGFDRALMSPIYSSFYENGETVLFTLPSFKSVKNDSFRLLCKYIHESLFGKIEEDDDGSDEFERLTDDDGDDRQKETKKQKTKKSLSFPKKKIIAAPNSCGWIHIIHII